MNTFKTPQDEKVHAAAQRLLKIHQNAEAWRAATNAAGAPDSAALRQLTREVGYLAGAAGRPPTVGFFGESRSGKSFLITRFGSGGKNLMISVGKRFVNFKEDVNAQHGGESTGIVCRFTSHPLRPAQGEDCLVARLISHEDLVASLAIGYLFEFSGQAKRRTPKQMESMRGDLARIESGARHAPVGRSRLRDVEAVWKELVEQQFSHQGYIEVLSEVDFPKVVGNLLSKNVEPPEHLLDELVAMLWGGEPSMTRIYRTLLEKLRELEFAEEVEVHLSAVVVGKDHYTEVGAKPGQHALTDVSLLDDLLKQDDHSVSVRAPREAGQWRTVTLRRSELSALILELTLNVTPPKTAEDTDVLTQADVLDFPGVMRADQRQSSDGKPDQQADRAATVAFRRGKLINLFLALVKRREINLLILAAWPHNLTAGGELAEMLAKWIKAEGTSGRAAPLLLVLTQSDKTLRIDVKATKPPGQLTEFGQVLQNVKNTYGDWMSNWSPRPGQRPAPFGETFLVCHNEEVHEDIKKYTEKQLADVKTSFLADPLVRAHVRDPEQKWAAFADQGEFGVDLLSRELTRQAESLDLPSRRLEEIRNRLVELDSMLRVHYCDPKKPGRQDPHGAAARDVEALSKLTTPGMACLLDMLTFRREDARRVLRQINRRLVKAHSNGVSEELDPRVLVEEVIAAWRDIVAQRFAEIKLRKATTLDYGVLDSLNKGLTEGVDQPWMTSDLQSRLEPYADTPVNPAGHREHLVQVALVMFNAMLIRLGKTPRERPPVGTPPTLSPSTRPAWRWIVDHWAEHLPRVYSGDPKIPQGNEALKTVLNEIDDLKTRELA